MARQQSAIGTLSPSPSPSLSDRWKRLFDVAIEILVGTALFLLIGALAVLMNVAANYLISVGVDGLIYNGLKFMEYTLFGADVVLFLVFLYRALIDNIGGKK